MRIGRYVIFAIALSYIYAVYPEQYRIPDVLMQPFIDADEIWNYLNQTPSTLESIQQVVGSRWKKETQPEEVAVLINGTDSESIHCIKRGSKALKTRFTVTVSLFAPLYVGNKCSNDVPTAGSIFQPGTVREPFTGKELRERRSPGG